MTPLGNDGPREIGSGRLKAIVPLATRDRVWRLPIHVHVVMFIWCLASRNIVPNKAEWWLVAASFCWWYRCHVADMWHHIAHAHITITTTFKSFRRLLTKARNDNALETHYIRPSDVHLVNSAVILLKMGDKTLKIQIDRQRRGER